jgi:uncharacterized protein DUF3175
MARQQPARKWSAKVTETSDALDLEEDIFKSRSAKRIAASLKRSAEHSHRRKTSSFQSAMSMLTSTSTAPARIFRYRKNAYWKRRRPSCVACSAVLFRTRRLGNERRRVSIWAAKSN